MAGKMRRVLRQEVCVTRGLGGRGTENRE